MGSREHVDEADLLEYLVSHDRTKVVLMYMERFCESWESGRYSILLACQIASNFCLDNYNFYESKMAAKRRLTEALSDSPQVLLSPLHCIPGP